MSSRVLLGCSLLLIAAAAAAFLQRDLGLDTAIGKTQGAPRVECPLLVDCGPVDQGTIAFARFQLENRGDGVLILREPRASCACAGLEIEEAGQFRKVESLQVQPGQAQPLVVRLSVRGSANQLLNHHVFFRTNDPLCPERKVNIQVQCRGGLFTLPTSLNFGSQLVGSEATLTASLIDEYPTQRKVVRVVPKSSGRCQVELLPAAEKPLPAGQRCLGELRVSLSTAQPGTVSERLVVFLDDAGTVTEEVTVSGQVLPWAELAPSAVLLPCAGAGLSTKRTADLLFHRPGLLALEQRAPLPGIHCEVVKQDDAARPFRLLLSAADSPATIPSGSQVLRFVARFNDGVVNLELPVHRPTP